MYHEKDFIKPEGKYTLRVQFMEDYPRGVKWRVSYLWFTPKGKRKPHKAIDDHSYEHRAKPFPEGRIQHVQEQIDDILTKEEQASAFQELYDLIKPPQIR